MNSDNVNSVDVIVELNKKIEQMEKTIEIIGEHENRRIKKLENDLSAAINEIGVWSRRCGYADATNHWLRKALKEIDNKWFITGMQRKFIRRALAFNQQEATHDPE